MRSKDGQWGPAHDAIELKRIGGDRPETTFGSVTRLVATPDGGVVLLDTKAAEGIAVRQFSADGAFLRTLGRKGSGPGEYGQTGMVMLAVHPNGTILIRDGGRAVLRYAHDGTFLGEFSLGLGRGGMPDLIGAADGSVYLRGAFPPRMSPMTRAVPAMLRYDSTGKLLDSVTNARRWLPKDDPSSMYGIYQAWGLLPDKRVFIARNDKLGFLTFDPSRKNAPLIGEITAQPVAFFEEERRELQAISDASVGYSRDAPLNVPEFKPPMRGLFTDTDGRIWLYRSTVAEKVEPRVGGIVNDKRLMVTYAERPSLVCFNADGTFLGEVRFPMGVFMPGIVGNTAWAVVPDSDDVPMLVKFKLHN